MPKANTKTFHRDGMDLLELHQWDGGVGTRLEIELLKNMMVQAAEAIVSKNRTVSGQTQLMSLCDLGYFSVGVDKGTSLFRTEST